MERDSRAPRTCQVGQKPSRGSARVALFAARGMSALSLPGGRSVRRPAERGRRLAAGSSDGCGFECSGGLHVLKRGLVPGLPSLARLMRGLGRLRSRRRPPPQSAQPARKSYFAAHACGSRARSVVSFCRVRPRYSARPPTATHAPDTRQSDRGGEPPPRRTLSVLTGHPAAGAGRAGRASMGTPRRMAATRRATDGAGASPCPNG